MAQMHDFSMMGTFSMVNTKQLRSGVYSLPSQFNLVVLWRFLRQWTCELLPRMAPRAKTNDVSLITALTMTMVCKSY